MNVVNPCPFLLFGLGIAEWSTYLGAGTALLVFLAALWKALKWLSARTRRAWAALQSALERFEAVASLAEEQLKTNGGGSLVDKVTRASVLLPELQRAIEQNHEEARGRWDTLDGASKANTDDVALVRESLEQLREQFTTENERRRTELDQRREEWNRRFGVLEAGARFWQLLGTELFNLAGPDDQQRLQTIVDRIRAQITEEGSTLPWPGG